MTLSPAMIASWSVAVPDSDVQAAAVARLISRDRAAEHVQDAGGIDAAAVARGHVGGDRRIGERQHTEVLDAAAVAAGRRAVVSDGHAVQGQHAFVQDTAAAAGPAVLDGQVVEEDVGPLGDLEDAVGPAAAEDQPRRGRGVDRDVPRDQELTVQGDRLAGQGWAKVIGVPWEALAIAWRSEPGPLSAVLVTTSGLALDSADVDCRARDPRQPALVGCRQAASRDTGTPSLL